MTVYKFRRPTAEDARRLALKIKADNKTEVMAAIGDNVLENLMRGISMSEEIGLLEADGIPLAIYGVQKDSVISTSGVVWLFLSSETEKHKYFVGRYSKIGLRAILEKYDYVYNYVDIGNKEIIRWLNWLGAEFSEPMPYGVFNIPHYYFEFRRDK